MVKQMTELVEYGLHLAMRQQSGLVANRRRDVSADQSDMGFEAAIRFGMPRQESVHPCAAAFVFPGKPVCVERADPRSVAVDDGVILNCGVPNRGTRVFDHPDSKEPVRELEHS